MALLRDEPFDSFETNPLVADAANELKTRPLHADPTSANNPTFQTRDIPPKLLFRGSEWYRPAPGATPPEHLGPFISQFLYLPIPFGSLRYTQHERRSRMTDYRLGGTTGPFMTTFASWLKVQRGNQMAAPIVNLDPGLPGVVERYIQNMGDLARYVHIDGLYEAYLNAALILLGASGGSEMLKFDAGNPYFGTGPDKFTKEMAFGTFGDPHVLSAVCEVATRALKAVWYAKFIRHLRLRPEAYSGLVHRALENEHNPTAAATALGSGLAVRKREPKPAARVIRRADSLLRAPRPARQMRRPTSSQ